MFLSTLTHSTLSESEGPVLFVRAGFDVANRPLLVVCFSRIMVVWIQWIQPTTNSNITPSSTWNCIGVGETSPAWSLSTTIVDCCIFPQRALQSSGAYVSMISFQACGDTKRHVLFDDGAEMNITAKKEKVAAPAFPPPPQLKPTSKPTSKPKPMVNEALRSRDKYSVYTASCVCGDNKLIVGTSDGSVKCWNMTAGWDRVMKVYTFKTTRTPAPKKKRKRNKESALNGKTEAGMEVTKSESESESQERSWSVTSLAGLCGCDGAGRQNASSTIVPYNSRDANDLPTDVGPKYIIAGLASSRRTHEHGPAGLLCEERVSRVVVFDVATKAILCDLYVRPTVHKYGTRSSLSAASYFSCIVGPCRGCIHQARQREEQRRRENERSNGTTTGSGTSSSSGAKNIAFYEEKDALVNATVELLRSRSTKRSRHKRRRRKVGAKANTSNTYVVMDWRMHYETGPSVEYLILRDGDESSGRWAHLLDVRRERESDELQRSIQETQEEHGGGGSQSVVIPQVELYRILVPKDSGIGLSQQAGGKSSSNCQQCLTLMNAEVDISRSSSSSSSSSTSSTSESLSSSSSNVGGAIVEMDAMAWMNGDTNIKTHVGICKEEAVLSVVTVADNIEKGTTMTLICDEIGRLFTKRNRNEEEMWEEIVLNHSSKEEEEEEEEGGGDDDDGGGRPQCKRVVFRWPDEQIKTCRWYGVVDVDKGHLVVIQPK